MKKFFWVFIIFFLFSGCLGEFTEDPDNCALPSVMVGNQLYLLDFSYYNIVDAPEEKFWVGTITSCIPYSSVPSKNEQTNQKVCLNQPYAFVNNTLFIHASGVSFFLDDGKVEYNYEGWFKCEAVK